VSQRGLGSHRPHGTTAGLKTPSLCEPNIPQGSPAALQKRQIASRLRLLMSSGSRKKEPRCTCLIQAKASHRQNVGRRFIHRSTLPAQWAACQPHSVEVPTQGIVSGKESGNHPGLSPVEGYKLNVGALTGSDINPLTPIDL
jgi:hypothetical protein